MFSMRTTGYAVPFAVVKWVQLLIIKLLPKLVNYGKFFFILRFFIIHNKF